MEKKYLEMTKMLNFDVESIQSLIKNRKWIELDEYNKIAAIYEETRYCLDITVQTCQISTKEILSQKKFCFGQILPVQ